MAPSWLTHTGTTVPQEHRAGQDHPWHPCLLHIMHFYCPPTATVVPRDQLSPRTGVPKQHCHRVVTCTPSKRP